MVVLGGEKVVGTKRGLNVCEVVSKLVGFEGICFFRFCVGYLFFVE